VSSSFFENAVADLGAQYVKGRGFAQGRILLGTRYMGHKFRGILPYKTSKIAPEMGFFHVKVKRGGRFVRDRSTSKDVVSRKDESFWGYEIRETQI